MQFFKSARDSALYNEILPYLGIMKVLHEIGTVMEPLVNQFDTCYLCEMSCRNNHKAYMNNALVLSLENQTSTDVQNFVVRMENLLLNYKLKFHRM